MISKFAGGRSAVSMVLPTIAATLATLTLVPPATVVAGESEPTSEASLISLTADSTAVFEILQILAQRSGLNIATGQAVQGRTISIRLRDTPFEEALNVVCRASGLGYERVGNSILVAEPAELATQTGLTSHVFELEYAEAVDVAKALEIFTPSVEAQTKTNRVFMRAPQSAIEHAVATVSELDRKPTQVQLEARLIEVNTSALEEIGVDWEKLTKWTGIFTEGDPGISSADALPEELDYYQLGGASGRFHRQVEAYEVAVDLLLTNGQASLLSNTRVVTIDGESAEIFAGDTVPVVITSLQSPGTGGVLQTVQLEKIDVGVRLRITPRVTGDGFITTLVEPEVSRIVAFVGPDDDLPQTSTRRARTLVRVRDGETIYLGGLLSEEERSSVKKVPLLGSIPILGHLFQHRRTEKQQMDLIIEITPRIVGDEGADAPTAPPMGSGGSAAGATEESSTP